MSYSDPAASCLMPTGRGSLLLSNQNDALSRPHTLALQHPLHLTSPEVQVQL